MVHVDVAVTTVSGTVERCVCPQMLHRCCSVCVNVCVPLNSVFFHVIFQSPTS